MRNAMFDLEREVAAWSKAVHADGCRNAASMAELGDHLHCEIDRGRAEGLSDEEAFRAAVARLGPASLLKAEHRKNRSIFGRGLAAAARYDRSQAGDEHRGLFLAHGLLWASLIIATSLVLSKADAPGTAASLLITLVFVPTWWGSQLLLLRALRGKPRGGAE
jgi:hypothetical protein